MKGAQVMNEIWKPLQIKGFEEHYFISNTGLIKTQKGRIRKITTVKRKHAIISLYYKDKNTTYIVKNLVANHFIPNPNNLNTVVNLDGNILNNATYNLRWAKKISWNSGTKEVIEQSLGFKIKVEIRRHGGREQLLSDISAKERPAMLSKLIAKHELQSPVKPGYVFNILCPEKLVNYSQQDIESAITKFRKQN